MEDQITDQEIRDAFIRLLDAIPEFGITPWFKYKVCVCCGYQELYGHRVGCIRDEAQKLRNKLNDKK